jgi:hypothetical protein
MFVTMKPTRGSGMPLDLGDNPPRLGPGWRRFPGAQFAVAPDQPGVWRRGCDGAGRDTGELGIDHDSCRAHDRKNLRKLCGACAARHSHRDCASRYRAEMEGDEVGRVKHQHAHAIIGTNARLAQACGELADARHQRAVAQRFLCAQDRGMLRPGELQTVQQAIFDRVHY